MKANLDFSPELLKNEEKFEDPFFKRFSLRHAPQPLKLNEKISKNYFFPTMYADVSCAIGIFFCDYQKAKALMPDPKIDPVRMTKGRSLVIFSCYEYKNVMNVPPYNEIAMTIPVLAGSGLNIPILPMVFSRAFSRFGYYVFGMPVTSKENEIRGRNIWGLPKMTQEIDITMRNGESVTVAKDDAGQPYFELHVPVQAKPKRFDVSGKLYSKLDGHILRAQTNFCGDFQVTTKAEPGKTYLKIHDSPASRVLKSLDIDEKPFQLRHTAGMNAAFDLPEPGFRLA